MEILQTHKQHSNNLNAKKNKGNPKGSLFFKDNIIMSITLKLDIIIDYVMTIIFTVIIAILCTIVYPIKLIHGLIND